MGHTRITMFLLCRIGLLTVTLNTNLNARSTVQSIKNLYLTLFKHIHNQCYCLLSLQDQLVYIIVQLCVDSELALYDITKCAIVMSWWAEPRRHMVVVTYMCDAIISYLFKSYMFPFQIVYVSWMSVQ